MDYNRKCYAVKNKDESIRAKSRSGGTFTAVSDLILDYNGVVYGCVMTDVYTAEHIRATTKIERDRMCGSKYIQSKLNDCYKNCAKDLIDGKSVLFSGTPCQIDALNSFLEIKKVNTDKLLTMDIVCHSVASPKVWRKYLNWISEGKKIEGVDFRDKTNFGWAAHKETIVINGKKFSSDKFSSLYNLNYLNPRHCFNCYYKNTDRVSDITIGDYWGIEKLDEENFDNKGVSLVMLNSKKGETVFSMCTDKLYIKEFFLMDSLQPALQFNYIAPSKRRHFFRDLNTMSFDKLHHKYIHIDDLIYYRVIEQIYNLLKR